MPSEIETTRTVAPRRLDPLDRRGDIARASAPFVEELLRIPAQPTAFAQGSSYSSATKQSSSQDANEDADDDRKEQEPSPAPSSGLGYTPPIAHHQQLESGSNDKRTAKPKSNSTHDSVQQENTANGVKANQTGPGNKTNTKDNNTTTSQSTASSAVEGQTKTGAVSKQDGDTTATQPELHPVELIETSQEPKDRVAKQQIDAIEHEITQLDSFAHEVDASKTNSADTLFDRNGKERQLLTKDADPATETRDAAKNRRRPDRNSGRARGDNSKGLEGRADSEPSSREPHGRNAVKLASAEQAVASGDSNSPSNNASQSTNQTASAMIPSTTTSPNASTSAALASALSQATTNSSRIAGETATATSTSTDASAIARTTSPSQVSANSVTGSPSRKETTSGGPSTSLTQYQESKLVQRVMKGLEQLGNGREQVRMRLHPPELGTLQLTLRIEGTHVSAQMHVENSGARDALLKNVQVLKDRLADQGMQVDRFDVQIDPQASATGFEQGHADSNRDARSRQDQATSRYALQNGNRIDAPPIAKSEELSKMWTRTNGVLDVKV